jgi:hypothetical protein
MSGTFVLGQYTPESWKRLIGQNGFRLVGQNGFRLVGQIGQTNGGLRLGMMT